ncbi:hypothetical protein [Actinomadura roseirufa]|uniref:hypothetical protein n=1 Tax=Actinomadura roseirufa TaxID=2094049 RepID=UPI00104150A3|nr:hypothetical protein [Actinomadura roseirufa]
MSRSPRPFLVGLAAAVSASAVGVAVNIATDVQGNVLAWVAVGVFTVLTGTVSGLVDGGRAAADPMAAVLLSIECEVRADGSASVEVKVRDRDAEHLLPHLPGLLPRGVAPSAPPGGSTEAPAPDPLPVGSTDGPANGVLPDPLPVALVTRGRITGIARRLREVGDRCAGLGGLDVRVCASDSVERRREAIRAAPVIFIDDHCDATAPPRLLVGGLDLTGLRAADGSGLRARLVVLGCHDGAAAGHTRALRRSLDRPAAFLACRGAVPAGHAAVLYPHVLTRLAVLAGGAAAETELQAALESALAEARRDEPQLDWDRWGTTVLHPLLD